MPTGPRLSSRRLQARLIATFADATFSIHRSPATFAVGMLRKQKNGCAALRVLRRRVCRPLPRWLSGLLARSSDRQTDDRRRPTTDGRQTTDERQQTTYRRQARDDRRPTTIRPTADDRRPTGGSRRQTSDEGQIPVNGMAGTARQGIKDDRRQTAVERMMTTDRR